LRKKDRVEVLKVLDAEGRILAYVFYEDEPIRRELMKRHTKDEARRIAVKAQALRRLDENAIESVYEFGFVLPK
jgi:hypothetical protein